MKKVSYVLGLSLLVCCAVPSAAQEKFKVAKTAAETLTAKTAVKGVGTAVRREMSQTFGYQMPASAGLNIRTNSSVGAEAAKGVSSSVGKGFYPLKTAASNVLVKNLGLKETLTKRLKEKGLLAAPFPGYYSNLWKLKQQFLSANPMIDVTEAFSSILRNAYPQETVFAGTMVGTFDQVLALVQRSDLQRQGAYGAVKDALSVNMLSSGFPVIVVGNTDLQRAKDVLLLDFENMSWISLNHSKGQEIAKQYQAQKAKFTAENPEPAAILAKQGVFIRPDMYFTRDGVNWMYVYDGELLSGWMQGFFIKYNSRIGRAFYGISRKGPFYGSLTEAREATGIGTMKVAEFLRRQALPAPIPPKGNTLPVHQSGIEPFVFDEGVSLASEASASVEETLAAEKTVAVEEAPLFVNRKEPFVRSSAPKTIDEALETAKRRAAARPVKYPAAAEHEAKLAKFQVHMDDGYTLLAAKTPYFTQTDQALGIQYHSTKKDFMFFSTDGFSRHHFSDLQEAREVRLADLKGYHIADLNRRTVFFPIPEDITTKFYTLAEADAYMEQVAAQRKKVEALGRKNGFKVWHVRSYGAKGSNESALFAKGAGTDASKAVNMGIAVTIEDGVARFSPGADLWFDSLKEATLVKIYLQRGLEVRLTDGEAEFAYQDSGWTKDASRVIELMDK